MERVEKTQTGTGLERPVEQPAPSDGSKITAVALATIDPGKEAVALPKTDLETKIGLSLEEVRSTVSEVIEGLAALNLLRKTDSRLAEDLARRIKQGKEHPIAKHPTGVLNTDDILVPCGKYMLPLGEVREAKARLRR